MGDDRRFRTPDPCQEQGRHEVAERVDDHRERRPEEADQDPRHARPQDLRRAARDLQLRVAVDELVALDDARQVALVGHVEEHGQDAGDEADDVQLPDRQGIEVERHRDRRDRHRPAEVAAR